LLDSYIKEHKEKPYTLKCTTLRHKKTKPTFHKCEKFDFVTEW